MRAFIVSVDYTDILSISLPYNRHHFEQVVIVTSTKDAPNVLRVAENSSPIEIFATDSFYANGAVFNKWAALEEALTHYGRFGWIVHLDADILWPKSVNIRVAYDKLHINDWPKHKAIEPGKLVCPLRRMFEDTSNPIPHESCWELYPIHPNINEFAGYSQIYHASDPVLGQPPWHQVDWSHAGGADSFFQRKWEPRNKIRPDFEVLHIGPAGKNWFGRATPYLDGTIPEDAKEKLERIDKMWTGRRRKQSGPDKYSGEKIT